ncbi:glycosyltransferase family 90 protein, partial [Hydnum rufescens UP504]
PDSLPASHIYRPDGLLQANPTGKQHPISELIMVAKREWARKIERQSTSLSQAVREYQRRYKRLPPRGFDIWWKFIIDNNVPLPDEYDQILHDLEPFFGISPHDLQWLQARGSNDLGTFTLGIRNGRAFISKISMAEADLPWAERRAEERLELIQDVQEHLPDLNFTFSAHDAPVNFLPHDLK